MQFPEPLTVKQIAEILKISFSGNPAHVVKGINEIHKVEKGDLTFVDHDK
jgi:UDP-3-O-[3-hydroxymyristoyl] glucosamine N-acyltransferase